MESVADSCGSPCFGHRPGVPRTRTLEAGYDEGPLHEWAFPRKPATFAVTTHGHSADHQTVTVSAPQVTPPPPPPHFLLRFASFL